MKRHQILLLACAILFSFTYCSKNGKTTANCGNGVLDANEVTVDCGGVCASCGTCSDGIQNQNETKVDCGGVCSACATCIDGIQNQGETGIDCGGPCAKCTITYPQQGIYGKNLLAPGNYDTTMVPADYSLSAVLPAGTKLRVVFSNPAGGQVNYGHLAGGDWYVLNSPGIITQAFIVYGPVTADKMITMGAPWASTGDARIDFYENDEANPSRVKFLRWK